MENVLLISDAAREVQVESHVLRYWEEELHLPIHRNELGHRYYTEEDVERFKQIKGMKERGLQLKAIKMILKDGKIDVLEAEPESRPGTEFSAPPANDGETGLTPETREEKVQRLQWLLQQMIRETLQENNRELCQNLRESVIKELDYQFRMQEEKEEERNKIREEREELHYQKLDELLRMKSGRKTRKPRPPKAEKTPREKNPGRRIFPGKKGLVKASDSDAPPSAGQ